MVSLQDLKCIPLYVYLYQVIKRCDVKALGFVWVRIVAKHWMVTRVNTKKLWEGMIIHYCVRSVWRNTPAFRMDAAKNTKAKLDPLSMLPKSAP